MKSWSAYKTGGRRKKLVTSGVMGFIFQSKCHMWWNHLFLRWLNTCLLISMIIFLVLFSLCECLLLYLLNCLYLTIWVPSLSFLTVLSHPTSVGMSICIALGYWLGLNHDPPRSALQPPLAWTLPFMPTATVFIPFIFVTFQSGCQKYLFPTNIKTRRVFDCQASL